MKSLSIARRALVTGGVVVAFLVGTAVAPGDPGNGALRIPLPPLSGVVGARTCGFPIDVEQIKGTEYVIHDRTLADGTDIVQIVGDTVVSLTNMNTGTTIVENLSASRTQTTYPDGSRVFDVHGRYLFLFGPFSQANTGEPGAVLSNGNVTVSYLPFMGGILATSFTVDGRQENLCDQLA